MKSSSLKLERTLWEGGVDEEGEKEGGTSIEKERKIEPLREMRYFLFVYLLPSTILT